MARLVSWTEWTPYRWFPWVEWRRVALELDHYPIPIDIAAIWIERRWRK